MRISQVMLLFGSISLCSCLATVNVTLLNKTDQTIQLKQGLVPGQEAIPKKYQTLDQIDSGKSYSYKAKLAKDQTLSFYGVLKQGGRTETKEYYIDGDITDSSSVIVPFTTPDDEKSAQNIEKAFNNFTEKRPLTFDINMDKDDAIKTVFGSLRMYDKDSNLVYVIPPQSLKSYNPDVNTNGQNRTIDEIITHNTEGKLKGSIPSIIDFNTLLGTSDVAKFHSTVNAGPVEWKPPGGKDLYPLFRELDSLDLGYLARAYDQDSTLRLYFIDWGYLVQSMELKSSRFKKLDASTEVGNTVFVTANGNYQESDETSDDFTITNLITTVKGSDQTRILKLNRAEYFFKNAKSLVEGLKWFAEIRRLVPMLPNAKNLEQAKVEVKKFFQNKL